MSTKKRGASKPVKGKGSHGKKKPRKEPYVDKASLLMMHRDDRSLSDDVQETDFDYDFDRAEPLDEEYIAHKNGTIYETKKVRTKLGLVGRIAPVEIVPPSDEVVVMDKKPEAKMEEGLLAQGGAGHSVEELILSAGFTKEPTIAEVFTIVKAQQGEISVMRQHVVQLALLLGSAAKGGALRENPEMVDFNSGEEEEEEDDEEEEVTHAHFPRGGGIRKGRRNEARREEDDKVYQCIGFRGKPSCGQILPASAYGRNTTRYQRKDASWGTSNTRRTTCKACSRGG